MQPYDPTAFFGVFPVLFVLFVSFVDGFFDFIFLPT